MALEEIFQRGPSTKQEETADDIKLADDSPLYHALLEDSGAGIVDKGKAQEAKATVRALFTKFPSEIRSLQGKSPEKAREVLRDLIARAEESEKQAA